MYHPKWNRLKSRGLLRQSALYVPAFLKRLHRDQRGLAWWPCSLCCPAEPLLCDDCTHCENDTTACDYRAVLAGISDRNCNQCDENFNDTFVVTQVGNNPCEFRYTINSTSVCNASFTDFLILTLSATEIKVDLRVGDVTQVIWSKAMTAPYDCLFSELSIPYLQHIGVWCRSDETPVILTAV